MKAIFSSIVYLFFSTGTFAQISAVQANEDNAIFSSFEAIQKGGMVQLAWVALPENNIVNHTIEKSINGSSFINIGTVLAKNSPSSSSYTFLDATPVEGINYYRLRSFDKKGNALMSNILTVNNGFGKSDLKVISNPSQKNVLNLLMENIVNGKYIISLYNNAGQKVFARSLEISSGNSTQTINLPQSLGHGIYYLQLADEVTRINKEIFLQ